MRLETADSDAHRSPSQGVSGAMLVCKQVVLAALDMQYVKVLSF